MRTGVMSAALASSFFYPAKILAPSNRYGPGVRNWGKPSGSSPMVNRHTGKPHAHAREIARRMRQTQEVTV